MKKKNKFSIFNKLEEWFKRLIFNQKKLPESNIKDNVNNDKELFFETYKNVKKRNNRYRKFRI